METIPMMIFSKRFAIINGSPNKDFIMFYLVLVLVILNLVVSSYILFKIWYLPRGVNQNKPIQKPYYPAKKSIKREPKVKTDEEAWLDEQNKKERQ
jgi:hypothetical protein